jgi:hypothetical protein
MHHYIDLALDVQPDLSFHRNVQACCLTTRAAVMLLLLFSAVTCACVGISDLVLLLCGLQVSLT